LEAENAQKIENAIIIGTAGVLFLIFFLIFTIVLHQRRMYAKRNELTQQKLDHKNEMLNLERDIITSERIKLAKNVHDDIGFYLTLIKQKLDLSVFDAEDRKKSEALLAPVYGLIDETRARIRMVALNIMPKVLNEQGFVEALLDLCNDVNAANLTKVNFIYDKKPINLATDLKFQLFRMCQEILNNIIKHSKPQELNVSVSSDEYIHIQFAHNGDGLNNEEVNQLIIQKKGNGLENLRNRALFINSSIDYKKEENQSYVSLKINRNEIV